MDRLAGAVDDRVVVVEDGCDVRSGEDGAELERELVGVGAGGELAGGVRLAGRVGEELEPLLLVEGDAVAYRPVPAAHFGGCGDEEAAAGEDPLLDVVEVAVTEPLEEPAAWGGRGDRGGDDVPDEARPGGVGAGAAGMAFVDALIAACGADVVMVDRRHGPGGHWHDAYPFVRLHGPSALYGVNSRPLGSDAIDQAGPNAGYYPRATAAEICAYYQRVLDEVLLPSGRVRFVGMSDYSAAGNGHQFTSRLTGETTTVRVRNRVVDARYLEPSIPATHVPPFGIDPGES